MNLAFFQKLLALAVATIFCTNITATAVEMTNEWNMPNIELNKNAPLDRDDACKYLIDAYSRITDTKPDTYPLAVNVFSDVNAKEQPYILQAYHLGFVSGTTKNTFSPDTQITKAQFASMIYNFAKTTSAEAELPQIQTLVFPDSVEPYFLPSLQFAYSRGIYDKQSDGTLGANTPVTLGEAAVILHKLVRSAPNYPIVADTYGKKIAYLTFDDSPSENTKVILDTLKKYNIKATFFISGNYNSDLLMRIYQEGHAIGNHTMSHEYTKQYASAEAFWADFEEEQIYLHSVLGFSPILMRFPGGSNNKFGLENNVMADITAQSKVKGYLYFDWNVDSKDATAVTVPKDTIVQSVLQGAKDKTEAIILMHQNAPKTTTAEALPEIIEGLQKMGFEFRELNGSSYCPKFTK